MSADPNRPSPTDPRRVLMVVANPATSPVTGWPVGFWWSELTHPWWVFHEAGWEVVVASPAGGDLAADSWSDPRDESGYSSDDLLTLGFVSSPTHAALVRDTPALADIDTTDFDAVFLVGGQSPMVTMVADQALHRFVVDAHESGVVTALVCHATCVLLHARRPDGRLLVEGKTWTGFADAEERVADEFVGRKIQPFWIEEEARRLPDTNFVVDQPFRAHAVRDGRLVTGQQQYSGATAARLVIETVGL